MMTCKEVAEKYNVSTITVIKWASNNNVEYIGEGNRKIYTWSNDDIKRFSHRNKQRGRPKTN